MPKVYKISQAEYEGKMSKYNYGYIDRNGIFYTDTGDGFQELARSLGYKNANDAEMCGCVYVGYTSFFCEIKPTEAQRATIIYMAKQRDRKSTRLNSSHTVISYAVFCLKKKNNAKLESGAALRTCTGVVFTAGNIKCVSYGLTMSAGHVAIFKAVCEGLHEFDIIAVLAS